MAKASYREGLRLWQKMQQVEQSLGIVKGLAGLAEWLDNHKHGTHSRAAERLQLVFRLACQCDSDGKVLRTIYRRRNLEFGRIFEYAC
jgi:hypothetical protein